MDQAARRATVDRQAEFRPMAVLLVVVGRAEAVAIAIVAVVHVVRQVTMARAVPLASPVAQADAQGSTTDRQLLSLHAYYPWNESAKVDSLPRNASFN